MNKPKEIADAPVRLYKSTRKRLKVRAAGSGQTLAELIDQLSKK